jgi:hypothetical protein
MKGFFYRLGIAVKDRGERWHCGVLIRLGFVIKGLV